jgi:hypothetical protein
MAPEVFVGARTEGDSPCSLRRQLRLHIGSTRLEYYRFINVTSSVPEGRTVNVPEAVRSSGSRAHWNVRDEF